MRRFQIENVSIHFKKFRLREIYFYFFRFSKETLYFFRRQSDKKRVRIGEGRVEISKHLKKVDILVDNSVVLRLDLFLDLKIVGN